MKNTLRHIVNFGLLFSFVTLGTTGVLAFLLPFSIQTTRIHLIFGCATLILVGLHLSSRLLYFKNQVGGRSGNTIPRRLLLAIAAVWALLLAAAIGNWTPVRHFVAQGYEGRHQRQIVRPNPLLASVADRHSVNTGRARKDRDNVALSIHVGLQPAATPPPAIAIWAESTTGSMIETLFISSDLAYSETPDWHGRPTPRKEILPVWRHRYTLVTGIDPDGKIDAVTGATETHKFSLDAYLESKEDDYLIFIEINAPGDPDATWPDPHIGQPSLIYSVLIDHTTPQRYYLAEGIGHGGDAEKSGAIRYDLETISSAKDLIDLVLVSSRKIPITK